MSIKEENYILNYITNSIIGDLITTNLPSYNNSFCFLNSFNITKDYKKFVSTLKKTLTINYQGITHNTLWDESTTLNPSITKQDILNKLERSFILIDSYKCLILFLLTFNNQQDFLNKIKSGSLANYLSFSNIFKDYSIELVSSFNDNLKEIITTFNPTLFTNYTQDISKVSTILNTLEQEYYKSLENILIFSNTFENLRVSSLGKNGIITLATKNLNSFSPNERKDLGLFFNTLKNKLNNIISNCKTVYSEETLKLSLLKESVDITLPLYNIKQGGVHPLTQVLEEVVTIFNKLGFITVEGPEIEDEHTNFSALNFSEFHPAKDSHDTFYFTNEGNNKKLLRTHTSTVQIRTLQNTNPPLKIIAPGKVYRSDDDSTHTPMFHQVEGLYVNKNVSIAQLKYVLNTFCEQFFGIPNVPLRFRPSYFPFTSPSLEVDIGCKLAKNQVNIRKGTDWLEILGCGMVHPNVLKNCNINPNEYSGFAFGMGLERLAMLKYGFPDLREFFTNNYLWLKSYNFNVIKSLYNSGT